MRALLTALMLWMCASPASWAMPGLPAARVEAAPLTLDQAVELVQRRFNARVVRAEQVQEGEETIYRLRLLGTDGRVLSVRVHARGGQVDPS